MMQAQPSLKVHGDEARWAEWAKVELDGNGMFGKVQRHGKVGLREFSIIGFLI